MKLRLSVDIDGRYWSGAVAVDVPELVCQQFEPLKICDDPYIAMATGEFPMRGEAAKVVIKTREDAAKILAEQLAEMIVAQMRKNDTHNGYKVNET